MSYEKWSGEGIPPVGTVCEYKLHESGMWFECEIKYVLEAQSDGGDSFVAWCQHLETDQFLSFGSKNYSLYLRPIKTPEQIAAEERRQDIDEMIKLVKIHHTYKDIMRVLYDAGYRKTEVKK